MVGRIMKLSAGNNQWKSFNLEKKEKEIASKQRNFITCDKAENHARASGEALGNFLIV